ncbi:hypothetical protein GKZ68_17330 [Hymenobacter sp. BRD128]|uniref:hypothetical protein n=1 Tax=Hymenobacter sp. BRD128 TaxID=2675878 RepID=UPI001564ADE6|nr:hypothetical protein [Hymenobacter sp. BRD128]QKG58230.1 hypothetical protein GKZ68_17330 [Hymenobacter sp. BRD128]
MNLRIAFCLLGCLAGLLGLSPVAQAQQPAASPDVLLLTTGQELSGRVLSITPTELTYLPVPLTTPDTLRLPVSSVFLVRYANGTREVLTAAPPAASATDTALTRLLGLSTAQRRWVGERDARRTYHQSGPFWGSFASAVALSPVYGLVPTACISLKPVAVRNLMAPQPELLRDAAYANGYQHQANRRKAGRAWAGYGTGTATYLAFFGLLVISLARGL